MKNSEGLCISRGENDFQQILQGDWDPEIVKKCELKQEAFSFLAVFYLFFFFLSSIFLNKF